MYNNHRITYLQYFNQVYDYEVFTYRLEDKDEDSVSMSRIKVMKGTRVLLDDFLVNYLDSYQAHEAIVELLENICREE